MKQVFYVVATGTEYRLGEPISYRQALHYSEEKGHHWADENKRERLDWPSGKERQKTMMEFDTEADAMDALALVVGGSDSIFPRVESFWVKD